MITVGIIGNGFVGNAITHGIKKKDVCVRVYDIDESRCTHSYEETINSHYVFVCLPTPMTDVEGGECNLSLIEEFFDDLPANKKEGGVNVTGSSMPAPMGEVVMEDDLTIFIIKSTVPIGTTRGLSEKYPDLHIVHSPEFITAANAVDDFVHSERHVLGGNVFLTDAVERLYKWCFPATPVHVMSSDESEAVKYISNVALALKVSFFTEMRVLCDTLELDWQSIIGAVTADGRIGASHTDVPGTDGQYGFGGHCFPKDFTALIDTMKKNGVPVGILEAAWKENKDIREVWGWEKSVLEKKSASSK